MESLISQFRCCSLTLALPSLSLIIELGVYRFRFKETCNGPAPLRAFIPEANFVGLHLYPSQHTLPESFHADMAWSPEVLSNLLPGEHVSPAFHTSSSEIWRVLRLLRVCFHLCHLLPLGRPQMII